MLNADCSDTVPCTGALTPTISTGLIPAGAVATTLFVVSFITDTVFER
jgi:hypothetical protein